MGKDDNVQADKPADSSNLMVKAAAGVFATVIAPLLVAVVVKFSETYVSKLTDKPEQAKAEADKKDSPKADAASSAAKAAPASDQQTATTPKSANADVKPDASRESSPATTTADKNVASASGPEVGPDGAGGTAKPAGRGGKKGLRKQAKTLGFETAGPVVRLFNQRDFSGWYKYVDKSSTSNGPPGRDKDPDGVYKVGNGMIHISGQYWGTLTTKDTYENYHLTVEFRWGKKTWGAVESHARTSGVLLHGFGPDGAHMGWAPQSIKCQINEGGTGDLVCFNTKQNQDVSIAVEAAMVPGKKQKKAFVYKPGEPLTTVTMGFVRRLGNMDDWEDVTGFHREGDIEKPSGQWNTLECICLGDRITVILNGKTVNEASNVKPSKGRISLQSHGAEIFFRKVELQKITAK